VHTDGITHLSTIASLSRSLGLALALLLPATPLAADEPPPLTDCTQLLDFVKGFDALGDLLTNLEGDPFADAFGVYIRDVQRLDREGRELSQRVSVIARNDCEPFLRERSQWTLLDAELRNSGCFGQLPEQQYAACKPRVDGYRAWWSRLETQRLAANAKIAPALSSAIDFQARAKMPLLNAQNVLNPDNGEDAFRLYIWWYLRKEGSPPRNSCRAFADLATVLGKRVMKQDLFIDWLVRNLVAPGTALDMVMTPAVAAPAGARFQATGFKPQFFDKETDNQVRHAAAHIRLGYALPLDAGPSAVYSFADDLARKYLHGNKPEWEDYRLGVAAGRLGFRLKSGLLHTSDFGDAIRSELCK
jgi:hypothetical protein